MPQIVTITFSPCIDKSTSVFQMVPEKKLKCAYPKLEPGGGGINIARAIKKLGGEAITIYPAGGYTGKYFNDLLEKENVPSIIIESQNETRENIIVRDESSGRQYRFGMPGNSLSETEIQGILLALERINDVAYVVVSGSLPPGVPPDIFARIAIITKKKKAKLIVDTSGQALKHAIREGLFLVKPNLGELSFIAGKNYLEQNDIANAAKQIIEKNKCEVIVVSMGKEGALLVTKDLELKFTPPVVKQKSTVGAGDSMVAGIIYSLSNGEELETAVQYGVACGTAATLNEGTELCRLEDAERLFNIIKEKMPEKIY